MRFSWCETMKGLVPDPDGEFCDYSDAAALKAQVEALQRENERLKTELDKYAVLMSYDWLGDQPIECGLWCDLCHEHVDEGVGHKSTCLLASRATQPAPQSTENGK